MRAIVLALVGTGGFAVLLAAGQGRTAGPTAEFLDRTYHLGSFSQKNNAMWEFVTGKETVDNWTSLLTVIDRPDARTRVELDRLSEGIMSTYKSRNGQILMAKTMAGKSGEVYNYLVVAFDESAKHRYELSFAKIALSKTNAYVVVYGVRIGDPDYLAKAKTYLTQHSGEIGRALENAVLPEIRTLPRKEF